MQWLQGWCSWFTYKCSYWHSSNDDMLACMLDNKIWLGSWLDFGVDVGLDIVVCWHYCFSDVGVDVALYVGIVDFDVALNVVLDVASCLGCWCCSWLRY